MLNFDISRIYIYGMKNANLTSLKIEVDTKEFGITKPIVLFVIGILIPIFTSEILLAMMSFVPFYGYMLWNEHKFNRSSIFVSRLIFVISIVLGIKFSVLGYNVFSFLQISGNVLLINIVPSFGFMIYTIFCVESKDPSEWSGYSPD